MNESVSTKLYLKDGDHLEIWVKFLVRKHGEINIVESERFGLGMFHLGGAT